MNISLPVALREWVDQQILQSGFSTASEYFRQLIREEQKRQCRLAVEEKLMEALNSGPPVPVTEATWKESRKRVAERIKAATAKRRVNGKNH
jgi:antitoxin ParD1/3/4